MVTPLSSRKINFSGATQRIAAMNSWRRLRFSSESCSRAWSDFFQMQAQAPDPAPQLGQAQCDVQLGLKHLLQLGQSASGLLAQRRAQTLLSRNPRDAADRAVVGRVPSGRAVGAGAKSSPPSMGSQQTAPPETASIPGRQHGLAIPYAADRHYRGAASSSAASPELPNTNMQNPLGLLGLLLLAFTPPVLQRLYICLVSTRS